MRISDWSSDVCSSDLLEVVITEDVQPERVAEQHDPEHGQGTEEPVLDGDVGGHPNGWPAQDAFFVSPSAALASFSRRFYSSLAHPSSRSTCSLPDSRMISTLLSSVPRRRSSRP